MYHIIVNPVAGKKKALKSLKKVQKVFEERRLEYTIHRTTEKGNGLEIVKKLTNGEIPFEKDEIRKIIILGGDGTLHEVLNGIADFKNARFGLIPSGTGNDFATALNIPKNVKKATELILEEHECPTDYLEVGGVRCMNIAGIGMDVDVMVRYNQGKHKNKFRYFKCLLRSLFSYKGTTITVKNGEETLTKKAFIATACNGTDFGGGRKICPVAKVDDGLLDVNLLESVSGWKLVKAFIKLLKGKILETPICTHFTAKSVRFEIEKPYTVQLDGELYDNLELDFKIAQGLIMYR